MTTTIKLIEQAQKDISQAHHAMIEIDWEDPSQEAIDAINEATVHIAYLITENKRFSQAFRELNLPFYLNQHRSAILQNIPEILQADGQQLTRAVVPPNVQILKGNIYTLFGILADQLEREINRLFDPDQEFFQEMVQGE